MGRYNEDPYERVIRMPGALKVQYGKRTRAVVIRQLGVTSFGRKKKNGSRLACKRDILNSINKTVKASDALTCKRAFPKINLKNPELTPKVTVVCKRPPPVQIETRVEPKNVSYRATLLPK